MARRSRSAAFISAWNEFMFSYGLINDDARRTLTPGIMIFASDRLEGADRGFRARGRAAIAYLQRFLGRGLAAGVVKG